MTPYMGPASFFLRPDPALVSFPVAGYEFLSSNRQGGYQRSREDRPGGITPPGRGSGQKRVAVLCVLYGDSFQIPGLRYLLNATSIMTLPGTVSYPARRQACASTLGTCSRL